MKTVVLFQIIVCELGTRWNPVVKHVCLVSVDSIAKKPSLFNAVPEVVRMERGSADANVLLLTLSVRTVFLLPSLNCLSAFLKLFICWIPFHDVVIVFSIRFSRKKIYVSCKRVRQVFLFFSTFVHRSISFFFFWIICLL